MDILNFETDQISIFHLILDCSDSMGHEYDAMRKGLEMYKEKIIEFSKSESNSIAICISRFNNNYDEGEFKSPNDFDTSYFTRGGTAMYDAIHCGTLQLDEYISKVIKENGVRPNVTFLIFTDGESNRDCISNFDRAKEDISMLNEMGVTTVFVAFGSSIKSELGSSIGFKATIDVDDRSILENFMGNELSKSTIEQSKSIRSLGSDFFSKAANNEQSEKLSNKAKTAIEDRKWLDDIFF